VLAGPRSEHGSSREEERRLLAAGDLPVVVLDRVGEPERRWLLERCAAVVFPSTEEGFGLMPFEAGEAGRPCLFAPVAALAETLGPAAAAIVPWDAAASAARAAPLLANGPARERHVAALRAAAARFRWADTAAAAEALYDEVLAAPPRPGARLEAELQREYEDFRARIGADGGALLGPGGYLPPEAVRPLLAALSRPPLRRVLLGLLRLLYRVGHRSG
jgi:hypothetical protein